MKQLLMAEIFIQSNSRKKFLHKICISYRDWWGLTFDVTRAFIGSTISCLWTDECCLDPYAAVCFLYCPPLAQLNCPSTSSGSPLGLQLHCLLLGCIPLHRIRWSPDGDWLRCHASRARLHKPARNSSGCILSLIGKANCLSTWSSSLMVQNLITVSLRSQANKSKGIFFLKCFHKFVSKCFDKNKMHGYKFLQEASINTSTYWQKLVHASSNMVYFAMKQNLRFFFFIKGMPFKKIFNDRIGFLARNFYAIVGIWILEFTIFSYT